MQEKIGKMGLYLVNGVAGNEGMPGAPLLHFSLLVDAPTGKVTGHAVQTQAVAPPSNEIKINDVTGMVRATGLGKLTKIVALQGTAYIPFPPPAIGESVVPFSAHFAVDEAWNGVGGWSLGSTSVEDVPVKSE